MYIYPFGSDDSMNVSYNLSLQLVVTIFFYPWKLSCRRQKFTLCIPWSKKVVAWVECVLSPNLLQCSLNMSVARMVVVLLLPKLPFTVVNRKGDVLEHFCKLRSWRFYHLSDGGPTLWKL